MTLPLREKKVGPYTVRELPMRQTLAVLKDYPEGHEERGAALLGASVFNGNGEPLGVAVLDLGSGVYRQLMAAHAAVNRPLDDPSEGEDRGADDADADPKASPR